MAAACATRDAPLKRICSYGLYSYGLQRYGLYSYGLCSHDLCTGGLCSYGLCSLGAQRETSMPSFISIVAIGVRRWAHDEDSILDHFSEHTDGERRGLGRIGEKHRKALR